MTTKPTLDPEVFRNAMDYLKKYFPVTEKQAEQLLGYCEFRRFPAKAIILGAGEQENYLNLVLSGLVRKYVLKGEAEITTQLATEGHIFDSEISFITRQPSVVYLQALEPTTVLSLHVDRMNEILENVPGADLFGLQLVSSMFIQKDEKHYRQLMQSTRERFLNYMENNPHMLQRVPQKYLASYLNIKPETFSRLKHLIRNKKPKG